MKIDRQKAWIIIQQQLQLQDELYYKVNCGLPAQNRMNWNYPAYIYAGNESLYPVLLVISSQDLIFKDTIQQKDIIRLDYFGLKLFRDQNNQTLFRIIYKDNEVIILLSPFRNTIIHAIHTINSMLIHYPELLPYLNKNCILQAPVLINNQQYLLNINQDNIIVENSLGQQHIKMNFQDVKQLNVIDKDIQLHSDKESLNLTIVENIYQPLLYISISGRIQIIKEQNHDNVFQQNSNFNVVELTQEFSENKSVLSEESDLLSEEEYDEAQHPEVQNDENSMLDDLSYVYDSKIEKNDVNDQESGLLSYQEATKYENQEQQSQEVKNMKNQEYDFSQSKNQTTGNVMMEQIEDKNTLESVPATYQTQNQRQKQQENESAEQQFHLNLQAAAQELNMDRSGNQYTQTRQQPQQKHSQNMQSSGRLINQIISNLPQFDYQQQNFVQDKFYNVLRQLQKPIYCFKYMERKRKFHKVIFFLPKESDMNQLHVCWGTTKVFNKHTSWYTGSAVDIDKPILYNEWDINRHMDVSEFQQGLDQSRFDIFNAIQQLPFNVEDNQIFGLFSQKSKRKSVWLVFETGAEQFRQNLQELFNLQTTHLQQTRQ